MDEANALGTAWLRLDLAPVAEQPALRDVFRRYLDSRLAFYASFPDIEAANVHLVRTGELQGDLWSRSIAVGRQPGSEPFQRALLPALNEMFDIATTRTRALYTHTSPVITGFLLVVILLSAVLAGHGMSAGKRRLSHRLLFDRHGRNDVPDLRPRVPAVRAHPRGHGRPGADRPAGHDELKRGQGCFAFRCLSRKSITVFHEGTNGAGGSPRNPPHGRAHRCRLAHPSLVRKPFQGPWPAASAG